MPQNFGEVAVKGPRCAVLFIRALLWHRWIPCARPNLLSPWLVTRQTSPLGPTVAGTSVSARGFLTDDYKVLFDLLQLDAHTLANANSQVKPPQLLKSCIKLGARYTVEGSTLDPYPAACNFASYQVSPSLPDGLRRGSFAVVERAILVLANAGSDPSLLKTI
jgi:hypothetical protein